MKMMNEKIMIYEKVSEVQDECDVICVIIMILTKIITETIIV